MRLSINKLLLISNQAISHALVDEAVQRGLARFGLNEPKLHQGRELLAKGRTLYDEQRRAYRAQVAATDTFQAAWERCKARYRWHLATAREALGDEREATEFLLPMASEFGRWRGQVRNFYQALLASPAYQQKLAPFKVTATELGEGLALLNAAEAAKAAQERCQKEARAATRTRDHQLTTLQAWLGDFVYIARRAFAQQPEVLAALGITQLSRHRPSAAKPGDEESTVSPA